MCEWGYFKITFELKNIFQSLQLTYMGQIDKQSMKAIVCPLKWEIKYDPKIKPHGKSVYNRLAPRSQLSHAVDFMNSRDQINRGQTSGNEVIVLENCWI